MQFLLQDCYSIYPLKLRIFFLRFLCMVCSEIITERNYFLPTGNVYMAQPSWVGWWSLRSLTEICFLLIYFIKCLCIESEQWAGLSLISRSKVLQQDAGGLRNCQFWTPRPRAILAYKIRQWTQQDPRGGSLDGKNGMTLKISIGDTNWSGMIANARPYFFKSITRKFMAK